MRPHYEALGRVASTAIANDDTIVNSFDVRANDQGVAAIDIRHRDSTVRISADPDQQYLSATLVARLTKRDDVDISDFPPATEVRKELRLGTEIDDFDGEFHVLEVELDDSSETPIFDGFSIFRPLYAYGQDYSFKHYRDVLTDVPSRMTEAFQIVSDEMDVDFSGKESIQPEQDRPESGPSFY